MAKEEIRVTRADGPPLALDEVLEGADWPKRTWDLPAPGTAQYRGLRRMVGKLRPAFPGARDGEDLKAPPA